MFIVFRDFASLASLICGRISQCLGRPRLNHRTSIFLQVKVFCITDLMETWKGVFRSCLHFVYTHEFVYIGLHKN